MNSEYLNQKQLTIRVAQIINMLPPIPKNVDRILNSSRKDKKYSTTILSMVKKDPGLCADVLHLAKEYSGHDKSIETLDEAFEYLGVCPLVELIRFCYANNAIRKHFKALKYLQQYFTHCQNISKSCRVLAKVVGISNHDQELYATAGLIHDIGRLVVYLASNRINAPLIGTTAKKMNAIDHDEKNILGLSHSEVGWQLCHKWDFSPIIQEAVLRHHNPLKENDFSAPGAFVFISHFLSYSDLSGDILSQMLPPELFSNINITIKDFIKARKTITLCSSKD